MRLYLYERNRDTICSAGAEGRRGLDAGSALPESKDGSCPMMNKLKYDQTWQISHYIEQCIIQYKHNHLVYEYGGGGGGKLLASPHDRWFRY